MKIDSLKKCQGKGGLVATTAMFLIVVFLWRDQSRMKADALKLAEQNARLQQSMATTEAALKSTQSELDFFKTGDFRKPAQEQVIQHKPVASEPVEEMETLFLQPPTVSQTEDGLVARFEFKPVAELPDQITLVVRVPENAGAKILKLVPAQHSPDTDVVCIVNLSGTLGMIEGTPEDLKSLAFELTVSAPVKARVRGSEGILDFELDITTDGCTAQQL
jgi:hypothetical protein